MANDPSVPPLSRLYWWVRVAECMRSFGRYADAETALRKAESLAEYCPGHSALVMARFIRVALNLAERHLIDATESLIELKRTVNPTRPWMVAIALAAEVIVVTHTKSLEESLHLCRMEVAAYATSGPFFAEVFAKIQLSALLAQNRRTEELSALLADTRAQVAGTYLTHACTQLSIIEAYAAIQLGEIQKASEILTATTSTDPDTDFVSLTALPCVLPELFSFGLEHRIGTSRIKTWIRRFSISPGETTSEHWPWPVIIRCMGKFSICVEDEILQFKGRAPAKPLELLKLLVSAGAGGLPARAIADQLWPDVEGDAALVNVDTNVHRLRKLFKQDPLLVGEGRVAINSDRCWVDAWALERLDLVAPDAAPAALRSKAADALRLYRGHFLDLDAEQAWAVAYREKLRSGLIRWVSATGKWLEQEGKRSEAAEIYESAIKLDNIAEPIYRQWMLCLRDDGENAEALKVYRRCKEMLSIVLGIQPSAETQTIAATLKV